MNINKKLLLIILSLLIFSNLSALRADEEKINLDEEELPAIDPFQGNSSVSSGQNEQASDSSNSGGGLLNGMRLVGTIISKNKNIAVDKINATMGKNKVKLVVQGNGRKWKLKQEQLSPYYITRFPDILEVVIKKNCRIII